MKITHSNAQAIISVATAVFWACAGYVIWRDASSGVLLEKGGLWMVFVVMAGLVGAGFWGMMARYAIQAITAGARPLTPWKLCKFLWCFSTIPFVLFFFLIVVLLIWDRI